MQHVIEFSQVSKVYRLGESRTSLRETLVSAARRVTLGGDRNGRAVLWALRDVTFQASEGEALGIIGPNGAGKTTILKLISNITQPTSGRVCARDRVASLIELGAGFHPDLTGRDNIYLNGAILGMTRRQIRSCFDQIVAFSGLEAFLDTPVKRYSSGMYARLAFSVAAWTGAKILLVDEVLAVGDLGFQAKCIQRMRKLVEKGTTVIFISHSLYYVNYFCNRALLLHKGKVRDSGEPQKVITGYQELMRDISLEERNLENVNETSSSQSGARIVDVQTLDGAGNRCSVFAIGDTLVLRMSARARDAVQSPVVRFSIFSSDGFRCFSCHNKMDRFALPDMLGDFDVRLTLRDLRLMPGSYSVSVGLLESAAVGPYDYKHFCTGFRVIHPAIEAAAESGVVYLPREWHVGQAGAGQLTAAHGSRKELRL